jgi:hypothetical protein
MKPILKVLLLLAFMPGGIFVAVLSADPPPNPPSPPGGGHGSGNNQPPAGAPIDGGLGILLVLGTAFGGIRLYKIREGKKEQI